MDLLDPGHPLGRGPADAAGVDGEGGPLVLRALQVLLDQLGCDAYDVLPLPILDEVQRLEGGDDVVLGDAGHRTQILDAQGSPVDKTIRGR